MSLTLQLVDDDVLVYGYVRQEIENKFSLILPKEIKSICYQFFKDLWNQKLNTSSNIEIMRDGTINLKQGNKVTVYG